jgi:hypothetical protein
MGTHKFFLPLNMYTKISLNTSSYHMIWTFWKSLLFKNSMMKTSPRSNTICQIYEFANKIDFKIKILIYKLK